MIKGLKEVRLTGTTNGSGAATIADSSAIFGYLYAVEWIDGTLDDNNTAVLSVTSTASGVNQTLHTQVAGEGDADTWYYPRVAEHDNSAVTVGSYCFPVINGTLSLTIAAGGDTKTGGCIVYYFQ